MTPDSLSSAIAKEPDHGGEEGTDMDRQDQDGAGNIRGEISPTITLVSIYV